MNNRIQKNIDTASKKDKNAAKTPENVSIKPNSREWKELVEYVEGRAVNAVNEIIAAERKNEDWETEKKTEYEKDLEKRIREGLESYRTEPPESNKRKYIDGLIRIHGKSKLSKIDGQYKNRHNALILEFIISKPMSRNQIMKRLGMSASYSKYELQLEKGIAELADIMGRIL